MALKWLVNGVVKLESFCLSTARLLKCCLVCRRLSVNDSNAGVTAVLADLGVLHTLTFLVQLHISRGALAPLFTGWCTEAKPIHIVYPPNRRLSKKVRVFVDWIAELLAKHDLIQRKNRHLGILVTG
jgi:DNA-binding transcriptional LysR family regulator